MTICPNCGGSNIKWILLSLIEWQYRCKGCNHTWKSKDGPTKIEINNEE